MPATHSFLPMDVLCFVLEAAYVTPDHTLWDDAGRRRRAAWFASTLRVAHDWYLAGQKSLYHRIELVSQPDHSITLLARTLSQKPHIARMIKTLHLQHTTATARTNDSNESLTVSVPLITETGRKVWRKKTEKPLPRLLGLCTSLTELRLDRPDLTELIPTLENIGPRLERVEIRRTHEVTDGQWESLVRSSFWPNLRSIRFDATSQSRGRSAHEEIEGLDTAFLGTEDIKCLEEFTCLEELEVVGFTKAANLWGILCVVHRTLKTLRCDQPDKESTLWLGPVATTLQTLVLSLQSFTPLADLSQLTRLEHLTIVLLPGTRQRSTHTPCFRATCITLLISVFELQVTERCDAWVAAAYIREVLQALDFGVLPNLARITLSATIDTPGKLSDWILVACLLTDVIKRRGLEFRLNARFEMHHPDLHKVDCFARERHEQAPVRVRVQEEVKQEEEPRTRVEPRHRVPDNAPSRLMSRMPTLSSVSASVRTRVRRFACL